MGAYLIARSCYFYSEHLPRVVSPKSGNPLRRRSNPGHRRAPPVPRYHPSNPEELWHLLLWTMRSSFAVFVFGRIGHRYLLRLAGVLGCHRRCEWFPWMRKAIAIPFWSLGAVAVTGVTGDKPVNPFGFCRESSALPCCRTRTKHPSLTANHCA